MGEVKKMEKTMLRGKFFAKAFRPGVFVLTLIIVGMAFLTACGGGNSGTPVVKSNYGGAASEISSNIFSYYLSYQKSVALYQYQYFWETNYGIEIPDSPELWDQEYTIEGNSSVKNYGDVIKLQTLMQVQQLLAADLYCKENNIALTKEQLNDIDVATKALIQSYHENSKVKFNMTLNRFGINDQIYKEIKKLEKLLELLGDHLFSPDTGTNPIPDSVIWDKFNEEYVRVKHILIRTTTDEYDEEGNPIEFSEEELSERLAKADDIYNKIIGGEDFETYYEESEDPGSTSYPNGYCFTRGSGYVQEFEDAGFDMKVDEVRMVETEFGMHIMKKFALTTDDIADYESSIISQLESSAMTEILAPYLESIEVMYDEVDKFNTTTADTMLDCVWIIS